jgi:hypothetical protein
MWNGSVRAAAIGPRSVRTEYLTPLRLRIPATPWAIGRDTFPHAFAGRLIFDNIAPLTFADIEAMCGIPA